MFKFAATLLGLLKMAARWFRDRSIHDTGRQAERLAVLEAERKAQDAVENVRPVTRDNLAQRLRDAGKEF